MTSRYFKKEIVTNPIYSPGGGQIAFTPVKGHVGVIEVNNEKLAFMLGEASRKRMGGIVEIDQDTFQSLMGNVVGLSNGNCSTWNGTEPEDTGIVTASKFYHSGDLGDILYGMVTVKEMAQNCGGAVIYLGPDNRTPMPTREPLTPARCNLIAPLLAAQPYVRCVEYADSVPIDVDCDLNQFRAQFFKHGRIDIAPDMNLARVCLKHFGQPLEADQKPWLKVSEPLVLDGKSVVISRTNRYHNHRFNWREIVRRYGKSAIFLGTETEWREFCREFGPLDYHKCDNLLEVARVIAGVKLFVGNQSAPYAIAEGLKQNAILEVAPTAPNCMFSRPNAWAVWKTPFKLPDLDALTNAVTVPKKVEFDEDYFMHGLETGVSNYVNYSWMPEVTSLLAESIAGYLGIESGQTLLDYGCARGYLVRAFREMGVSAFGCDISEWAIQHCDETVTEYVSLGNTTLDPLDWVIAKDVLEHIPADDLKRTLENLLSKARKGMFIVVPLTAEDGGAFICPRDNQDATHVIRWTLGTWLKFLRRIDTSFIYHGSFHIPGIKQASEPYEASCGFITAKRIVQLDRIPPMTVSSVQ